MESVYRNGNVCVLRIIRRSGATPLKGGNTLRNRGNPNSLHKVPMGSLLHVTLCLVPIRASCVMPWRDRLHGMDSKYDERVTTRHRHPCTPLGNKYHDKWRRRQNSYELPGIPHGMNDISHFYPRICRVPPKTEIIAPQQ